MKILSTSILSLALCSGAAFAQTQSVEVRGHPLGTPRTDLHQLCPSAHDELPDALASVAQDVATAGVVVVQFELDGSRVRAVNTQGGALKQARAVRRAVQGLDCSNGQAGRQLVQFNVRFVDPFERRNRSGNYAALVEVPATQR
jgi:hypothetical protein